MAFVVITNRVTPIHGSALRQASRRVAGRLRHLGAPLAMTAQQRAERYVANLPTAVVGVR